MLLQGLGNRLFTWATGTRTHMRSTAMKNLSASKACVSEIDRRFCTLVLFIFCCYYCRQAWCPQPRIAVSVGVLKQAGVHNHIYFGVSKHQRYIHLYIQTIGSKL